MEEFTPSPGRLVRVVNEQGKVIKEYRLNRKDRRRLGIREVREDKKWWKQLPNM